MVWHMVLYSCHGNSEHQKVKYEGSVRTSQYTAMFAVQIQTNSVR